MNIPVATAELATTAVLAAPEGEPAVTAAAVEKGAEEGDFFVEDIGAPSPKRPKLAADGESSALE